MKDLFTRRSTWRVIRGVATTVAAVAARRSLARTWRVVAGSAPPKDPARQGVAWREAVAWAALSAAVGATARLAARQVSGRAQLLITGEKPEP